MQTTSPTTPPLLSSDPIGYIMYYMGQFGNLIPLIIWLVFLLILYFIVIRFIKRTLKAVGMGPGASTGISLGIRLVFFVIIITVSVELLQPDVAAFLSLTAIFGTAMGLAFSQALGNIVSGLYVLMARPFQIGDYVRIGNIEGIVREITLNYTLILLPDETVQLVPNSRIVTSEVTNFKINIDDYIETMQQDTEEAKKDRDYSDILRNAVHQLRKLAHDDDAYRYTFDLTYHMSFDHGELRKHFDRICEKWKSVFLIKPSYQVWAAPNAGLTYRFAIIVSNPMTIIKRVSDFMSDLTIIYDKA